MVAVAAAVLGFNVILPLRTEIGEVHDDISYFISIWFTRSQRG